MRKYAQYERQALCDTALRVGPDAPTLCSGWTVRDLMAHLAMRDRRPEAAGVVVPKLADWAEHTRRRYTLRPFEDLVDMVRKGPHELSVFRLPKVADFNLQEFFIHHEDILRGSLPEADPDAVRHLDDAEERELYDSLPMAARMMLRGQSVRLAALCPGFAPLQLTPGTPSAGEVVIKGTPGEIMLFLAGRMSFVEFDGDADDINRFISTPRSI